jgi:hypothetical protein
MRGNRHVSVRSRGAARTGGTELARPMTSGGWPTDEHECTKGFPGPRRIGQAMF